MALRVPLAGGWVDPTTGAARIDGKPRELTPRELELLRVLLAHPGELLAREVLLERVWGPGHENTRVVDVNMLRLRSKLERDPAEPDHLVTVHGEGYRLVLPGERLVLYLGEALVDLSERAWLTEGDPVKLSHEETRLLRTLAAAEGAPVDRAGLQLAVWGPMRRAALHEVDYLVHQLRKKIERDPSAPRWVRAGAGRGYWLDVPAGATQRAPRTNLSPPKRALIGRRSELVEVRRGLAADRLVCVTGTGGAGKSRLARQIAAEALEAGAEAWLCELTTVRTAAGVGSVVASTLGVPPDALTHALAGRGPVLVVLDDADEVADACVEVARGWLEAAPDLQVVVTSRVRPSGVGGVGLRAMEVDDAARLFVDRVREVAPSWDAARCEADIRTLVAVLDGLPLAIELAAALAPGVPPARQLEEARHEALSGTLGRSWDRLEPQAQAMFAQLSVFPASFSLDAVEAVAQVDGPTLPVLDVLHRHSLVHDGDAPGRFTLLATLRAFAAARLDDGGAALARHRAYFEDRAHAWYLASKIHRDRDALASLQLEDPDLVQAGTPRCVLGIAYAHRGRRSPGVLELLDGAIDATEPGDLLARLYVERAVARHHIGDTDGARGDLGGAVALEGLCAQVSDQVRLTWASVDQVAGRWEQAEAWLDSIDTEDPVSEAEIQAIRGVLEAARGRHAQAEEAHQRSAAAYEALGRLDDRARQLYNLAVLRVVTGRPARALGTLEQVVAAHRRSGNEVQVTHALTVLGGALLEVGDLARAEGALAEALALARRLGNRPFEATILGNLGNVLRGLGRPDEALELHQQAWELHRVAGHFGAALALLNVAADAISAGRPEVARTALDRALVDGADTLRIVVGAHCLLAVVHGLWGQASDVEASARAALALAPEHGAGRDEGRVLAQTVAVFADIARARSGDPAGLGRVRDALAVQAPGGFQMVRWARGILAAALEAAEGSPL